MEVPAIDDWFCHSEAVWESIHLTLERVARTRKHFADQRRSEAPQYHPGDQVWLATRDIRGLGDNKKLTQRYIGPYKIIKQINPVTYQLELPKHLLIQPTFHVS